MLKYYPGVSILWIVSICFLSCGFTNPSSLIHLAGPVVATSEWTEIHLENHFHLTHDINGIEIGPFESGTGIRKIDNNIIDITPSGVEISLVDDLERVHFLLDRSEFSVDLSDGSPVKDWFGFSSPSLVPGVVIKSIRLRSDTPITISVINLHGRNVR